MTLTQRLAEIRARAEAATPGPWRKAQWGDGSQGAYSWNVFSDIAECAVVVDSIPPDAAFIAASRTDIPLLLSTLDIAIDGLKKIGYTQDVSPADANGGPCRIHVADSRNRRIIEAQDAYKKIERLLTGGE